MDVRDQAQKINKARDQFREAREQLRTSYEKDLGRMKENFTEKNQKQSLNYADHKSKLEEQNRLTNELYSEKTKTAISREQEHFKNRLRENIKRFEFEKKESKNQINEKLAGISDSYKRSFAENDRYQDQIKKSMQERYMNANKRYADEFNNQVNDFSEKAKLEVAANRNYDRAERIKLAERHGRDLDEVRMSADDSKIKEVSRAKDENEKLRTTLTRENRLLNERQEKRVSDLYKMKSEENEEAQRNYKNLQQDLHQKNLSAQEKQNLAHKKESKELENRFNRDIENIQKIADQEIRGGTKADSVVDELKQTKKSYENRLQSSRDELAQVNKVNTEREEKIDTSYREQLKQMKVDNIKAMTKLESKHIDELNQANYKHNEKNNESIERSRAYLGSLQKNSDEKIAFVNQESGKKMSQQRVEFGRLVNTMNDKNMETINAIKDDFSKDKSDYIERSKKDFNEEKVSMLNHFNRQTAIRESLYEQKLSEMEKQTNKIIENYENKISQIVRKTETEVEAIKNNEEERKFKESQSNNVTIQNLIKQNKMEMTKLRDKFEGIVAKDRIMTEQQTNQIVQKYEDQLGRERIKHQKELSIRLAEAQSQFDRLYKSSELEKETIRNQYEQRLEKLKLTSLKQENSKIV